MSLHNIFHPEKSVNIAGDTFIFKRMDPCETKKILKDNVSSRFHAPYLLDGVDMFPFWLIRESRKLGALTIELIIYDGVNKKWWGYGDKEEGSVSLKPGTQMSQGTYIRKNTDGTVTEFCVVPTRIVLMNKGWARINTEKEYQINLEEMGGLMTELTADNAGKYYFDLIDKIENNLYLDSSTRIDPYVHQQSNEDAYKHYKIDIIKINFTLKS